ncbi:ribosomal protein L18e/L15P [Lipomyces arxii]|uniref:mitochondrial 54S ribosomal protein uL15m n=1 Tax=Lipomyces arxii TaxID=56418 RepID=UPI0034CD6C74
MLFGVGRVILSGTLRPNPQVNTVRTIMSALTNNRDAYRRAKRLGRGPSSGKGKTSGRGQNGQHKREGNAPWFEGGQTPMHKMLPKLGFRNRGHQDLVKLNVSRLQSWIDQGRLDPTKPITMKELLDSRACRGIKDGVKILATGKDKLSSPINITVTSASKTAIEAIEAAGGTVVTKHYNRLSLRALLKPQYFETIPIESVPTSRRELGYYRNPETRGYLAPSQKA